MANNTLQQPKPQQSYPPGPKQIILVSQTEGQKQARATAKQQIHTTRLLIMLFVCLCLGSTGSLFVAQQMLPAQYLGLLTPTPVPKTSTTWIYPNGECTAQEGDVTYQNNTTPSTHVPSFWTPEGRTESDLQNAEACASSFAILYESFDYQNTKTLEQSTSLMSSQGKYVFYQGGTNSQPDNRVEQSWITQMETQKTTQTTQVSAPTMTSSKLVAGQIWAEIQVPAHLSTTVNGQTSNNDINVNVDLESITPDPTTGGTGWNVADWNTDSNTSNSN